MQSTTPIMVVFLSVLVLALVNTGESFQAQIQVGNSRSTQMELFGKRARIAKKVKKILGKDNGNTIAVVEPEANFPTGKKIKLSNGRAKDLAKKYKDIDDVGERAFQILLDLNMVGRA